MHLALGHEIGEEPELLVGRHLGVDAVQLEQVDALDAESPQAELALLAEVLRPTDGEPLPGSLTGESRLGGDDEVLGVGVERLEDQAFAHFGAIGVSRVDEVDAHVDGTAQHGEAGRPVGRLVPHARSADLHGAVAESVDGGGPVRSGAEGEGPARADRLRGA